MHARPLILAGAVACALLHVTGVLFGRPVWRWAEVVAVLSLLAYTLLGEPRVARWALPAALGVLAVDALRTVPEDPAAAAYGLRFLALDEIVAPSAFERAAGPVWAAMLAAAVLLAATVGGTRVRRWVPALAMVAVTGYASFRVATAVARGAAPPDAVRAALPPLALALGATVLATVLAAGRHRAAAAGSVLLVLAALAHLDTTVGSLPAGYRPDAFRTAGVYAGSTVRIEPALTAALELAALLFIVAGLTRARVASPPRPAPSAPSAPPP